MVHGLYSDSGSMLAFAKRFADDYRVILLDAIGHGLSAKPARFTLADQGEAVAGLIEALGYERADLLGESMGSYIAAQAAVLHPDRIRHLVLLVTKGHGRTSSVGAYMARRGLDPTTLSQEQLMEAMSEALWAPATPPERRAEILAETAAEVGEDLTPEQMKAVDASLADFDLRPGLPGVTCPTLVVSGAHDGLNPPALGQEVAELIPGARFEVMEQSGHMAKAEEPEALTQMVKSFLAA
jgi:pimeloyl-ACP methyl ester carboxylesterase